MKKTDWTRACLGIILIACIVLDLVPRFHFGDSGSYLATEFGGYMPDDRSWLYGLAASWATRISRDLTTVALAQIVMTWVGAILLGAALAHHFRVGPWFVVLTVLVIVCDPLSFFWARSFMADASSAAVFAALVAVLFAAQGIVVTAIGVFLLAYLLCALRSVYLPPLLAAFAAMIVLSLFQSALTRRRPRDRAAAHGGTAVRYGVLFAAVLLAQVTDAATNQTVLDRATMSTNYATMRFMVSAWSPLMGPALAALDLPPQVTDGMAPLTYENRLVSAFADNGIAERLSRHFGGYDAAEPVYLHLLKASVLDSPRDFAALIARSWFDYLDPAKVLLYHRERRLSGATAYATPDVLPPEIIARLKTWGIWQGVYPELPQVPSFGLGYYAAAGGYWSLLVAMHATFAVFLYGLLPRRNRTPEAVAMQLFAFAYMAMLAMTANELVTRYLIPLDVPLLATVGLIFGRRLPSVAQANAVAGESRYTGGTVEDATSH